MSEYPRDAAFAASQPNRVTSVAPEGRVVRAVLDVLSDRKGFDWWWDDIDATTKREIKREMAKAVARVLAESAKAGGNDPVEPTKEHG